MCIEYKDFTVDYDTAILVKSKGFDREFDYTDLMTIPSEATIHQWLRREKKIHVEVYCNASGWGWILTKLNGTVLKEITNDIFFNEYEDALGYGIKNALNLL